MIMSIAGGLLIYGTSTYHNSIKDVMSCRGLFLHILKIVL